MARPHFVMWVAFVTASLAATRASSPSHSSSPIFITVDQSGKDGQYKRIQDAIDAVPSNTNHPVFIWGKDGSIFESATLSILASNFVARFLTIQNTYGSGDKAVALRVSADKAAFYGCIILSYQDTLLDDAGRHYYSNCYIQGATDFICGNALSLFYKCHLQSLSKGEGAITAQRRSSPAERTGFSFVNCKVTGEGSALLGRAWGAYSRVVFAHTYMANIVLPQGWDDWNDPRKQRTVFYGQYRCSGPGSNASGRVGWSHQLSSVEAAPFLTTSMIDGPNWLRSTPLHFTTTTAAAEVEIRNK